MSQRLISIVVPVYNERPSLAELAARVRRTMDQAGEDFELLFVDDGSTDGTADEIRRLRAEEPRIGLIRHQRNGGKSLALMQAFAAAEGDIAVIMDGDLQDEPEQIPCFLARIDEGHDVVNGRRAQRCDRFTRRAVSWVYNRLTSLLYGMDIRDINCGFKALRKPVYKRLELRGDMHRLIPVLAGVNLGFRVTEIPISHANRKYGASRYRLLRHRGLLDIFAVTAFSATRWRPFHVFVEGSVLPLVATLALGGTWLALQTTLRGDGPGHAILATLSLIGATWSLIVATTMWLVGFLLEVLLAALQGPEWRSRLVAERIEPERNMALRTTERAPIRAAA